MISFFPEGRAGNFLFEAAAAIAYARRHGIEFSMPQKNRTGKSEYWSPVYFPHLINPKYDPSLPEIIVEEKGFRFQELPFEESWRDKNITLKGYFQSPRYFDWCMDELLKAFAFPWELRPNWCAVHLRRGDYLVHVNKHPVVSREWYLAQMSKVCRWSSGMKFLFLSDDINYCLENFGYLGNAFFASAFETPSWFNEINETRLEVRDLIAGSQCEHVIGSASTFAVWMGLLGRNPGRRCIIPKEWICEGWSGTTADSFKDVVPEGWERA